MHVSRYFNQLTLGYCSGGVNSGTVGWDITSWKIACLILVGVIGIFD
jgi:hypothetical protein